MSDPSGLFDPEGEEEEARQFWPSLDTSTGQTSTGLIGQAQDSATVKPRQRRRPNRAESTRLQPEAGTGVPSLGTWSLILVTLGVIASPLCLYLALAELHLLSFDPVGDALIYFALGTIAALVAVVGCGLALAALRRRQPRTLPLTALAAAFLAGPLLTIGGASLGLDAAQDALRSEIESTAGKGAEKVAERLDQGVDLGPLDWLVPMILDEGYNQSEEGGVPIHQSPEK